MTGGRYLAERAIVEDEAAAQAFHARALAAGHEGVMAKDLEAPYEPGGRGKRWFKLKVAETVDCVIIAADRGSGRRVGWLSNYHLAVRDGERASDQSYSAGDFAIRAISTGDLCGVDVSGGKVTLVDGVGNPITSKAALAEISRSGRFGMS